MSNTNPGWLIAQAVKTELTAAFASPTDILPGTDFGEYSPEDISVIAPGSEETRPQRGARSWINIFVPEDTPLVWETGNSYLSKPNIRVMVCVEEVKKRADFHEQCLALTHFVTVVLTRSTLVDVARRAPRQTGGTSYTRKGETQTAVGEVRLEYEYQGQGGGVNWPEVGVGHDFGTVYLTATETRTLIIHNPGTGTLGVTSITVPTWVTAGALPATVAAGASEEVVLTLNTSEAGTYTGDIVLVTTADTMTIPVEMVVSSGTPPSSGTVCVMGATYASITTAEAATWTATLRVRNDGSAAVAVDSVTVPDGFTVDTDLPASIDPDATESLILSLTTADVGTRTGDVVVTLEDGVITFPLTIEVTALPTATVAFTDVGTTSWTVPEGVTSVQVLVVGGGGAGGSNTTTDPGGGGGAGGLVYDAAYAVTPTQNITVIVGAGGGSANTDGANSSFGTLVGLGGGAGRRIAGNNGGSGGGGGASTTGAAGGTGLQPASGSGGFGNNGGTGYGNATSTNRASGGGGGAGAVGATAAYRQGGNGGAAKDYSAIFGTSYGVSGWFAGGGGGAPKDAQYTRGTGGGGGAGNGSGNGTANGETATANTGSGGGGVGAGTAGNGGSGVVLIRYTVGA